MDALRASYASSSDSDSESSSSSSRRHDFRGAFNSKPSGSLPTPPIDLLHSSRSLPGCETSRGTRVRSFPHVKGNYAIHVFIPVCIPPLIRKELQMYLKRVISAVPSLYAIDADIQLSDLCKDDGLLEQFLGNEFHISLGRTVPIRVHQIGSIVTMLQQKFQSQKRYWIDFSQWEVFVNDDKTRTFLSIEITAGGLSEITRQINAVNDVYRLHNLPEFYKNPRPHISLAWALGDMSHLLKQAIEELKRCSGFPQKHIFTCRFDGIECKIGKKSYKICKLQD